MSRNMLITSWLLLLTTAGCEDFAEPQPRKVDPAVATPAAREAHENQPDISLAEQPPGTGSSDQPAPPLQSPAEPGVGIKGSRYGGGVITEPVSQYFQTRERIVFQIQIPSALRDFKMFDPNGKGPQSHEQFMEILQQHQVKLPELPPGHRYVFDPQQQTLMVERPAAAGN